MQDPRQASTRPAAVAGMFYPRDPQVLLGEVRACLHAADFSRTAVRPKLLVVPHAGYVYSGPIAGSAYVQISPWAEQIRRVVLLGPAHRVALHGLAVPTVDAFDTPFGPVPLDRDAIASLATLPQVVASDAAHAQEHSLEVQLPFLQAVLGRGFTLVPLVVGHASAAEVAEVVEKLWGGDETLIVISSDLSHYLPDGDAKAIDARTAARIVDGATDLTGHEACGAHALNGALRVATRRGLHGELLDLRNSGDTAGDRSRVVGYGAMAFAAHGGLPRKVDEERLGAALLSRAHNTIAQSLGLRAGAEPGHPALARMGATFVSLHDATGRLRGCIGHLRAVQTLDADVRHNAAAAAFRDPRFAPLTAAQWPGLHLEVSLLGEPAAIDAERTTTLAAAAAVLQPGIDGVVLEAAGRQATFLPQVWEQLRDAESFLAALLHKAGLPPGRWPEGVRLSRYAVQKFERRVLVS